MMRVSLSLPIAVCMRECHLRNRAMPHHNIKPCVFNCHNSTDLLAINLKLFAPFIPKITEYLYNSSCYVTQKCAINLYQ